ncbi:MAG TPA: hypothetical protein VGQ53_00035 [Chitinophagaceae bacterium]|jgi:Tol biopolymer transport system component|nr:hypothetical protein [Chitinophagaceae bacterium]
MSKWIFFLCFLSVSYLSYGQFLKDPGHRHLYTSKQLFANVSPDLSPDGETIVFESIRYGGRCLYTINKNGKDLKQLTDTNYSSTYPVFSPDGNKILFVASFKKLQQICTMNRDGSDLANISNTPYSELDPVWLPDGKRIVFTSLKEGKMQVYLMNADGSNRIKLSYRQYNYDNNMPIVSPDGKYVLFNTINYPKRNHTLFNLKSDSGELLNLGQEHYYVVDCFSADSRSIFYHTSTLPGGEYYAGDLFIYDIASKTSQRIKKNYDFISDVVTISQDTIALAAEGGIFIINLANRKSKRIADCEGKVVYNLPNKRILFDLLEGDRNICIINTDGTGFKNLTKPNSK